MTSPLCGQGLVRRLGSLAILCVFLPFVGCTTVKPAAPVGLIGGRSLAQRLAQSAEEVARAQTLLSQEFAPPGEAAGIGVTTPKSGVATTPVSISWIGPALPVLQKIARILDYKTKVIGDANGWNPIVSVRAQNTSAFDIVRTIGTQLSPRGGVYMDPRNKTIELIFLADEAFQPTESKHLSHPDRYLPRSARSDVKAARSPGSNEPPAVSEGAYEPGASLP